MSLVDFLYIDFKKFFLFFSLGKIGKSYSRVEKASQKVCAGKLKQPS